MAAARIVHGFFFRIQAAKCFQTTPSITYTSLSSRRLFSSPLPPCSLPQQVELANDGALLENEHIETERKSNSISASPATEGLTNTKVIKTTPPPPPPPPPSLSVKEKTELASYAHSLGKELKSQQVGKFGVTDTVIMAIIETLDANELVKLKIRNTCPGEFEDVVKQLEKTTGSVAVGRIGRTAILYRPSMKAERRKEKETG